MDNLSLSFPGFRFHPTDEELVVHYLNPKVLNSPLPADVILEIDNVCKSDPWDLPGDLDGDRYFFSRREDKKIGVSGEAQGVVGIKKSLVFYKGKPSNGSKTDWMMHEYSLGYAPQPQSGGVSARYEEPTAADGLTVRVAVASRRGARSRLPDCRGWIDSATAVAGGGGGLTVRGRWPVVDRGRRWPVERRECGSGGNVKCEMQKARND
nr:NAC domain-containing protein 83-like [Ipomoea trifida]